MFYNVSFFAKPSMDFIQLWHDDRALPKILCSTIPIPVPSLTLMEYIGKFVSKISHELLLYCVKENQDAAAYHSLFLSIFLSLQ